MGSNPTPGIYPLCNEEVFYEDAAQLAQLVERRTFNPVAVGSSPTLGISQVSRVWSKGCDLRSHAYASRVQIPHLTNKDLKKYQAMGPVSSVGRAPDF